MVAKLGVYPGKPNRSSLSTLLSRRVDVEWPWNRKTEQPLTERVRELESEMKSMQLEWEEMYDKFRRLLARISKRQEAVERAEAAVERDPEDPRQLPLPVGDRHAQLNAEILAQRGRRAIRPANTQQG